MKERKIKGSFTIEATYLTVSINLLIGMIVSLILSIYNVSIITARANLLLLEYNQIKYMDNEELENIIFDEARKNLEEGMAPTERILVKTETNSKKLEISYVLKSWVSKNVYENLFLKEDLWEYKIEAKSNRIRIEESLRLMKRISQGKEE